MKTAAGDGQPVALEPEPDLLPVPASLDGVIGLDATALPASGSASTS